ncbi:MAG: hypothetical protein CMJ47_00755 [Planctomyces sp.]|nr:hypothetical protein [Planctomyces sp.]
MQSLLIVALSIVACVFFGIVHDQITARICVEYFTIGHPVIVPTRNPTTLAFLWGVIATWWVGAILGGLLAIASRFGKRPKLSAKSLVRPILRLLCVVAMFAVLAGIAGYIAALNNWVWLVGDLADRVPDQSHVPFLVNMWVHSASYFAAFVGGITLIAMVWRSRRDLPHESAG